MSKRYAVTLYTDGSCKGNGEENAVGGWAYMLDMKLNTGQNHRKTDKGWFSNTTNNAMELQSVIEGIRALKKPCDVKVVTDSTYVVTTGRTIREFAERNWHTKAGKKMAHLEGWLSLIHLCRLGGHKIIAFEHIKGHDGHPFNEECDRLACAAAQEGKLEIARIAHTAFGAPTPV